MKSILTLLTLLLLIVSCTAETSSDAEQCGACHPDILANATTSLHYEPAGMIREWGLGAGDYHGINMSQMYEEKNCAKCHVTSCTQCHGIQPHSNDISGEISTCDVCHSKKQACFSGKLPKYSGPGPSADVHYELNFTCSNCHIGTDVHGDGTSYNHMLDAVSVECEDCHTLSATESHTVHGDKVGCSACHAAWIPTCVNCHLDTMKTECVITDKFYLARASDGKVKSFMEQKVISDDDTHVAYAEYYPHTTTRNGRTCEDCHENEEIFCSGGQLLGPEGASFVSFEDVPDLHEPEPEPVSTPSPKMPGFGVMVFVIAGLLAYRRNK